METMRQVQVVEPPRRRTQRVRLHQGLIALWWFAFLVYKEADCSATSPSYWRRLGPSMAYGPCGSLERQPCQNRKGLCCLSQQELRQQECLSCMWILPGWCLHPPPWTVAASGCSTTGSCHVRALWRFWSGCCPLSSYCSTYDRQPHGWHCTSAATSGSDFHLIAVNNTVESRDYQTGTLSWRHFAHGGLSTACCDHADHFRVALRNGESQVVGPAARPGAGQREACPPGPGGSSHSHPGARTVLGDGSPYFSASQRGGRPSCRRDISDSCPTCRSGLFCCSPGELPTACRGVLRHFWHPETSWHSCDQSGRASLLSWSQRSSASASAADPCCSAAAWSSSSSFRSWPSCFASFRWWQQWLQITYTEGFLPWTCQSEDSTYRQGILPLIKGDHSDGQDCPGHPVWRSASPCTWCCLLVAFLLGGWARPFGRLLASLCASVRVCSRVLCLPRKHHTTSVGLKVSGFFCVDFTFLLLSDPCMAFAYQFFICVSTHHVVLGNP